MSDLEIHHTGLVVTDLEEALSFYRDVLEFDVVEEFTLSGDGIGTAISVDGVVGDFAHLDVDGSRLEVIEYEPAGEERVQTQSIRSALRIWGPRLRISTVSMQNFQTMPSLSAVHKRLTSEWRSSSFRTRTGTLSRFWRVDSQPHTQGFFMRYACS
jgi:catechol 2,3-dioxygenase-like lactoylglutathione lyase family enzyme